MRRRANEPSSYASTFRSCCPATRRYHCQAARANFATHCLARCEKSETAPENGTPIAATRRRIQRLSRKNQILKSNHGAAHRRARNRASPPHVPLRERAVELGVHVSPSPPVQPTVPLSGCAGEFCCPLSRSLREIGNPTRKRRSELRESSSDSCSANFRPLGARPPASRL